MNKKLTVNQIRTKFLTFFVNKQHKLLSSFPLIPDRDKSLLLINSGMAPMKPYFSGAKIPPALRVTTCQKCVRTPDLEVVGTTSRHATFFEMLGNFSFGDYFKQEAIAWAWEFVNKELSIPINKLYVSVFYEDEEAFDIWKSIVSEDKIVKLGKKDNFWEIGVGPCGPCSEIYYDRGLENGCGKNDCKPGCDCDRFIEIWNLVFTQFNRTENGEYELLSQKNIDTGMGLERLASVVQGVNSIFEINTMQNILGAVSKIANVKYGQDKKTDVSLRIICDHLRTSVFLVSDDVTPSNEGRGYVLRCLIRRAARHGILLKIDVPNFLSDLVGDIILEYKENYPELEIKSEFIRNTICAEEDNFGKTIKRGLKLLEDEINKINTNKEQIISGGVAFKLYDTYGFPLDITKEIVKDQNIEVDVIGFERHMAEQRNLARQARNKNNDSGWSDIDFGQYKVKFIGYEKLKCESEILAIFCNKQECNTLRLNDNCEETIMITSKTVFYPEGGGQIGDHGIISNENFEFKVSDTQRISETTIIHKGKLVRGTVRKFEKVTLEVDEKSRTAIARNHTATHLLHKALENILGPHVIQKGSHISSQRLRFDFPHIPEIDSETLKKIEDEVNQKISLNISVNISEMSKKEALNIGVTALFDDKYKEKVRVVTIGNYSAVLCGGCHVHSTSQLGVFKITSIEKIAAGVRRIEAINGEATYNLLTQQYELIRNISAKLKCGVLEIENAIKSIESENIQLKNKIGILQKAEIENLCNDILTRTIKSRSVNLIFATFKDNENGYITKISDALYGKVENTVCVLLSVDTRSEEAFCVITCDQQLIQKKIYANQIFKNLATEFGGKGGGRKEKAQGVIEIQDVENLKSHLIEILER